MFFFKKNKINHEENNININQKMPQFVPPNVQVNHENEWETTLLSQEMEDREGETTLLSEEDEEEYEEEYEGQTSLLSEELSPYFNPEQYNNLNNNSEPMNSYENEEDDIGGTTLLSSHNQFMPKGIELPKTAPEAFLIRIIKSEKFKINKIKYVVGSNGENADCVVDNSSVSRQHAYIIYDEGKYYIVDNNSTNKTFLDGEMIQPLKSVELYNGALIQFSDELFQFVCK